MIREIDVSRVRGAVQMLIEDAAYELPDNYLRALEEAQRRERSLVGQSIILMLRDNAAHAQAERIPTCQDTGMAIMWLDLGQDIHFIGGDLNAALEEGVREAYRPLRKSVLDDPLRRVNTGDNTPPIIHYNIVPGDQLRVTII